MEKHRLILGFLSAVMCYLVGIHLPSAAGFSRSGEIFSLMLTYDDSDLIPGELTIRKGFAPERSRRNGPFYCEMLDQGGTVLY